jgi:Bifunctional DNA primase/polymerase, N-terminal
MTSGGRPCGGWTGESACGATPARLYPAGWRCADHTPARLAGQPEPPAIPPPPVGTAPDGRPPLTRHALKQAQDERRTRMLDAALGAAARGWHVFPLRLNSKRPAFPDHTQKECDGTDPRCRGGHTGWEPRATTDPGRIRRGWALTPWNVGIACGPSRLVVVDLDTPKPGDTPPPEWDLPGVRTGADVLAVLCERAGEPYPSGTRTVATPSSGTHLYFTAPEGGPELRNTQGSNGGLGWLVDTRAGGGLVVAAGSTVDGRRYTVTCDEPPAPLPAWLAGLLRPAELPPQKPVAVNLPDGRAGGYLRRAVDGELARVLDSPARGHNTALYRAAIALGQLVAGGVLDEQDVTAWLTDAAARVGQKPGETARTVASGMRAGASRPRSVAA